MLVFTVYCCCCFVGEIQQKGQKRPAAVLSESSTTDSRSSSRISKSETDTFESRTSSSSTTHTDSSSASGTSSSEICSRSCSSLSRDTFTDTRLAAAEASAETRKVYVVSKSPTPETAAITGRTSDGLIKFAESSGHCGKPADASLKSSQFVERSSLSDRNSTRTHPYRSVQRSQRWHESYDNFTFRRYDTFSKSVSDLLHCHASHSFNVRPYSKQRVNLRVLLEVFKPNENRQFSSTSYRFVRATRENAQRILGETNIVDDLDDVEFTAAQYMHFDEKKRMAQELDKALDFDGEN